MIEVRKLTGVDLSQVLHDNHVVFFRDQKPLSEEEHIRLGRHSGMLDVSEIQSKKSFHPEVLYLDQMLGKSSDVELFHRDRTYLEARPLGSILQCMVKPEMGGDTCWASLVAA